MLDVDCDIVGGDWDEDADWETLAETAVRAALDGAGQGRLVQLSDALVEVSVRLTDDAEMQRLNRDYRGKDKPTNVLSFPMHAPDDLERWLAAGETDLLLGDLALGAETVTREADEKGISVDAHMLHLMVHGTLHLLGHDHLDDETAEAMEALETRILAGLGIANPYAETGWAAVDERQ
ncbi:rRNA maturation RNase YbeY [Sandaracinobacter neustonicus]|uniref:Endoribonuclease YbeY n=1 Tax=Sandaracinobacter neustonicus TaxID=1715348 RepID=A0A501XU57_9SPHN|nr:rRNA maturation RNase YbeY [Sandaracinobacter neustonicus]TPE63989.1 rRNA maturation RNase YbeY [Sandaracinobacter neustonicus]